ncbi:PREDICTED: uncharacterized protein LOC107064166 isoform X2 [Polistes dominula]|uniref:Uncharacterized protein LOC107064166 isoform X2 n=1 Tax=Polistes dominula TaxID=743375 RepID=A0ABM1HVQ8_POLDO|nr:PREDICTED: uncharacterized protein LOC107064166 isoform X2 [Polistes dominula]
MAKERVNGRYLSQKIGEDVILLGTISRKSSNGKSIELLTTDSMKVNVTFDQPLSGNDEGYIEVHGVAQSKEANQYNDLCSVLHLVGSKKWSLSTDYGL